jgi:hypothetical protein
MATASQIEANRANAQLSTGPVSAEGIANCRHNATKHGLTGKQIVVKGENPADYDALREQLIRDYAPACETEAMLIEDIAQNYWRLMRARRVEAEVIAKFGELECILDPDAAKAFRNVTRYLNNIEKNWRRSTQDLERLQKARKQDEQDAAKTAELKQLVEIQLELATRPSTPTAPAPPIGSVLQKAETSSYRNVANGR